MVGGRGTRVVGGLAGVVGRGRRRGELGGGLPGGRPLLPGRGRLLPGRDRLLPGRDRLLPRRDRLLPGRDRLLPGRGRLLPGRDRPVGCRPLAARASVPSLNPRTSARARVPGPAMNPRAVSPRTGVPGPAVRPRSQGPAPDRRDQAGVQQGGLSGSRGADQHDQTAGPLGRAELVDQGLRAPLPAEEPPGVLPPVRGQPPVRTHATGDGRGLGRWPPVLLRGRRGPVAGRSGHRQLPQPLPVGEVVQAGGDRCGTQPPRLRDQDVQDRREGGELGRYVPGPAPVADPLRGHPYRPAALIDPLEPCDRFGDALEGRISGLLVQQREALGEGCACP
ncbi:hypothetical protein SHJG_5200 [Streptomyces hygroscopicus subsp. jinggangensis 5008]|nr:hypothetical protein SHJG_5200 [Streptomyces hygroscopicus subsp. jinggangensis 5008]AGF64627.1 hypothetical protein SHJGH_4964 [Streptomyces hygroscopicus subsp. jinggangensis TL01]